jgi:acetoin utilization deacetylase AcuC-like enzyme
MKAVFSAAQLAHAPTRFLMRGRLVDYPEAPERARRLLVGARDAGATIHAARQFSAEHMSAVHSQAYLDFLESAWSEWSAVPDAGPELWASMRPHRPVEHQPRSVLGRAGMFTGDLACPITAATWSAACASAATALTAASLVAKGESCAYALCRPPGHHAYSGRAGGFCYLNNSAIAAQFLRANHERVAILDIDVHHGNGTQAIFYARNDILTVSVHADPEDFYPFYYGYAEETGVKAGEGFNLNIPLPVKSGDEAWLDALEQALQRIREFAPGALVIALGLDAHEADPLQGGAVTTGGYARLAEKIAAGNWPTVIVQEGGYLTPHLGDNLSMFLSAFEGGRELDVDSEPE